MNQELQQQLYKDYPKIFAQTKLPMTETCMCWGLECGPGWESIIRGLCGAIQSKISNQSMYTGGLYGKIRCPQVEFTQVKQKFGTLRVYWTFSSDCPLFTDEFKSKCDDITKLQPVIDRYQASINGMVHYAEHLSEITCEVCGKPGKLRGTSWVTTLCDECNKPKDKHD